MIEQHIECYKENHGPHATVDSTAAPISANSCARNIGANVKRLRERNKITKTRFAAMLGIGRPLLNKIESGTANPRIKLVCKMAEALEVEPWELLMPPESAVDRLRCSTLEMHDNPTLKT